VSERFELALFTARPELVSAAGAAGIDTIVVDWERAGKAERQKGADTQIGSDGPEDLRRVRAATAARVICRVNRPGKGTEAEIDLACDLGADEVLIPMVEEPCEVVRALDRARGRCGVGLLVETLGAVAAAGELARLPLTRAYVGLNDLAIARGTPNIFRPVVDGLLEEVRRPFRVPFGFGGLTIPHGGIPIPCRLLIAEMDRLGCDFGFLRRSFLRDVPAEIFPDAIAGLRRELDAARGRDAAGRARDREELVAAVGAWPGSLFDTGRHASA
jgi:hypothetical protein